MKKKTPKKKTTKSKSSKKSTAKRKTTKKSSGDCFVMMPFREPFEMYYSAIFKPAIISANLSPIRADDLFRPSPIVADLWSMIQKSKVLLAELTDKNANVFYELGLAHAIGKPVVLVSETLGDIPFDLQQLRVLLYDKDEPDWGKKLEQAIETALKETLGTPVDSVPSIFRKKVESQAPKESSTLSRIDQLEKQVGMMGDLSRRSASLRDGQLSIRNKLRQALEKVKSDDEFEVWVDRAKRYMPKSIIIRWIRNAEEISEAKKDELIEEHF
jgi:hypothetical protein